MPQFVSGRNLPTGVKTALKAVMPSPIQQMFERYRASRIQRQYAGLSLADTFDRIYDDHAWGGHGTAPASGTGSRGRYVHEYCRHIAPLLTLYGVSSLADLGCGDFHIGKELARMTTSYVGVDISRPLIRANQQAYGSESVRFV